jgi:biotin operon repressor
MIMKALIETGWKYGEAAGKLRMSRTTLWRRIRELGIEKGSQPFSGLHPGFKVPLMPGLYNVRQ